MTEQELREKIARWLYRHNRGMFTETNTLYRWAWDEYPEQIEAKIKVLKIREDYRNEADQILDFIKKNYVRLAEVDIVGFLEKIKNQVAVDQEKMRRNGFVIDNLDDPWQKLAFTLYTDIAALSTEAEQLLEAMAETEKG